MTDLPWKPNVYLPINLTVRLNAPALEGDDPKGWCHGKAAELLGPDANHKQVGRLERCLEEYVMHMRSEKLPTTAALFFYPDFTHIPPRAIAEVYVVGPDAENGPMTLARAREICGPDELSFGDAEMTETEVPAGMALRVHRYRRAKPTKRRGPIGEEVAWFIWPPGSTFAVMMFTRWMEPAFSKVAITIADDMAKNFRIEPTA